MSGVTKINRLLLLGIEGYRKENPTYKECRYKTGEEIDQSTPQRLGDQLGIVGQDEVDKRGYPTSLWRPFRGICLIYHGINPLSEKLFVFDERANSFAVFTYEPSVCQGKNPPTRTMSFKAVTT